MRSLKFFLPTSHPFRKRLVFRLAALICMGVLCMGSQLSLAQSMGDLEEQRRRAQQEAEERQRQQSAPDVRLSPALPSPAADALDLPEETPCFVVNDLHLEGPRLESFGWLQSELDRFAGRCVGRQGIDRIVQYASSRILSKGYITTRLGVPEQDISNGHLRLVLVPGIVRAIRINDDAVERAWRSAFPVRPGDLLNLRDIEQGLEQMKRVPSQDVSIEIAPGEAPGESDIVLTVQRDKPWRLGLSLDDSGLKATGRMQASLNGTLDNPLGLNDQLNISVNNDADRAQGQRGTSGHSVQYSLPWGYWTFSLSDSYSRYLQSIQGTNQIFHSSGDSHNQEIRIQRLVYRDQTAKTTMQFRVLGRESRSYIEDAEILVQRRHATAAELGISHRHNIRTAQLDLSLAYRQGVPWFGGQSDGEGHSAASPTFGYRMQIADATVTVPFAIGTQAFRWQTTAHGQTTGNVLYAADFIAIGNRYTVRGFSGDVTLAAERGATLRNQLEMFVADSAAVYLGLDRGWVSGPSASLLAGRQLTGAVLGARGAYRNVSGDVFVGTALAKPEGFAGAGPVFGFLLSLQL